MSARYVARRLLQVVPTVFATLTIAFLLIRLTPGDPVLAIAGEHGDPAYYEFMRHRFGLDQSLPRQFVSYVGRVIHGDLGYSYVNGRPTAGVILDRVPATLLLSSTALLLSLVAAVPLGTLAAARPFGARDHVIGALSLVFTSTPAFWVGQLAILGLALGLGLFPVQGMTTASATEAGLARWLDVARHLALPAAILAAQELAVFERITRRSLLDELSRDHLRTARAKGLSARQALIRHALPRAILPVVTVAGTRVGHLLAGAAIVEILFGWPGIGSLLIAALQSRDMPILLGIFVMVSFSVVLANVVADLITAAIDPRVRHG
ncbi:MAG: ABC transporter permease [Gemmatimonadaceae bacterium]|nr:ABC transporter permease [Gemmatimonadaceae bacterium]